MTIQVPKITRFEYIRNTLHIPIDSVLGDDEMCSVFFPTSQPPYQYLASWDIPRWATAWSNSPFRHSARH